MKIELAKIEEVNEIHKLIYERCKWFDENKIKGWNVNEYPKIYII